MTVQMYFEPDEVWDFYKNESNDTDFVIATDEKFGIEIYVSANTVGKSPLICVESYGDPIAECGFDNSQKCAEVVSEFYDRFLNADVQNIISAFDVDSEAVELDIDEIIDDREDELMTAAEDFLKILEPDLSDYADCDEVCEEIVELVSRYLLVNYDISVYRPMFLEDEKGNDCLSLKPYEEMEI